MNEHRWVRGARPALAICVAAAALLKGSPVSGVKRQLGTLVIGATKAAPMFIKDADGTFKGLIVDVINEAARRKGYAVSWRGPDGEPDAFLTNGEVDLWATVSATPARLRRFHLTEPWLHNRYCIVSTADAPVSSPKELAGKRVAFWGRNGVNAELAHQYFPRSVLVPLETRSQVVEAVCKGQAVAGMTPDRILEPTVLERPASCKETKFVIRRIEGAESPLSIAANRDHANAADALLESIQEMAADGSLALLGSRWTLFGMDEASSLIELRHSKRWIRVIAIGLAFFSCAAFCLLFQLRRGLKIAASLKAEVLNRQKAEDAAVEAFARMEQYAYHDSLTGLANRLQFDTAIQEAVALADHLGHQVALFYIDLDRFKQINDSLGHCAGDELLRQTAERLKLGVPAGSFLARLGGDEFAVVLSVTGDMIAMETGRHLKEILAKPFLIQGLTWHCPGSIGVSHYPGDARNALELQKNADTAMYRAKKTASAEVVPFARHMGEQQDRSARIEQAIWRALANCGFSIHYQAQFDGAGELYGYEALLRLTDESLGPVSPAELIPVAEKTGSIVQIGEWVLREACRQAVAWTQLGLPPVTMSVNVSPLQLCREDFSKVVLDALNHTGMPAYLLELEITETAIVDKLPDSLLAIQRKGVRIAIDDFGTGYSSLGSLHRLPVDCVKIDRSFVTGTALAPGTLPFIRAIVALARSLDMEVVAEGVETQEQFEALRNAGCNRFQGFLLARPQPEQEAVRQGPHHFSANLSRMLAEFAPEPRIVRHHTRKLMHSPLA